MNVPYACEPKCCVREKPICMCKACDSQIDASRRRRVKNEMKNDMLHAIILHIRYDWVLYTNLCVVVVAIFKRIHVVCVKDTASIASTRSISVRNESATILCGIWCTRSAAIGVRAMQCRSSRPITIRPFHIVRANRAKLFVSIFLVSFTVIIWRISFFFSFSSKLNSNTKHHFGHLQILSHICLCGNREQFSVFFCFFFRTKSKLRRNQRSSSWRRRRRKWRK